MKAAWACAAAVLLGLTLASPTLAAAPQANLPDIEDEVMCPICGTLLELSGSPQAEREKAFISGLIAQGKSKQEIKDALMVEYGDGVLALPEGSGFNLSAYLVPAIALLIAIVALALGVFRWRRAGKPPDARPHAEGLSDEDSGRLEADLAKYDL